MPRALTVLLCVASLSAFVPAAPAAQDASAPRLVVILVVDQMRADYLTTFAARWKAGFRTLLSRGTSFTNAEYPYWSTITCAGHSSISTGTLPRTHGMVLNRWWDRAERRIVTCNDDAQAAPVSYQRQAASGASARRLLATTFADELRAQKRGARVVSISLKPRSAIGLAGHGGDAVVWFDDKSRSFLTSTAFASAPVPAVARFMASEHFEAQQANQWQLEAPASSYRYPDDMPGEKPDAGWTSLFPHPLAGLAAGDAVFADHWQKSPYSDAYLGRLAASLVDEWKLGQRDTTDFLGISFSALDMVGHEFGPRSREVEDILIGLDRTLGTLIEHLDARVGRDRYVLALTADHGVAVIPEQNGAGRIANEQLGAIAEQVLTKDWGARAAGSYVAASLGGQIYFSDGVLDRLKQSPKTMRALDRALLNVPGVSRVIRPAQLGGDDPVTKAIARGYVPDRSGDLFVVPRRDWIIEQRSDADATTHGTMYEYDRRVPLLLMGTSLPPGPTPEGATPLDIAPTLAAASGITMVNREGRSLLSGRGEPAATRPADSAAAASGLRGTPQ